MKIIKISIVITKIVFGLIFVIASIEAMKPTEFTLKSRRRGARPVQQTEQSYFAKATKDTPRYKSETVWVKTSDGKVIEIPKWQIDQIKMLQMAFVYQKGENSKKKPIEVPKVHFLQDPITKKYSIKKTIDPAITTEESIKHIQKALIVAGNQKEFTQFCDSLTPEQKANLINAAFTLEAVGLAALLAEKVFPKELQQQLGAARSNLTGATIIEPVTNYLEQQGAFKKNLIGHTETVTCVAISPHGDYIVSGSDGKKNNLILWNGKTGEQIKILQGHLDDINCVAFSPNGEYIVSGASDESKNNLILWNGKTGEQIRVLLQIGLASVACVAFSPNGEYMVSGLYASKNNLILWNVKTGKRIDTLQGHPSSVSCVAFSPDGEYIVSGSYEINNNLILWNGKTGKQIKILQGHNWFVNCVAYSPDGKYIVSGSEGRQNNLILWDGKTGEQIKILQGQQSTVFCVAFSAHGEYIVSGARASKSQKNLILWNRTTGDQIKVFQVDDSVNCVAFSLDDKYIISGSHNAGLILWSVTTGERIKLYDQNSVNCVEFSPDGKHIVSGSSGNENNLILWQLIDQNVLDFIKTKLSLSQARFVYRLYTAMLNKVSVIIDEHDQDYATYKALPDDVKKLIDIFLPFTLASKNFATMVEEKKNVYRPLFIGLASNEKIAKIKQIINLEQDKNSVAYKACQELLNEFETEAAFEF